MKDEITWEQIRRESGYPHEIEERTSVTNKARRVGRFEWDLARAAVRINRPTRIAVNGLDYLDFTNYALKHQEGLSQKANDFVDQLKKERD